MKGEKSDADLRFVLRCFLYIWFLSPCKKNIKKNKKKRRRRYKGRKKGKGGGMETSNIQNLVSFIAKSLFQK